MADFPDLRPASRRYSMGIFPATVEASFSGGAIRFLHGTTSSGHTLELAFTNLTQDEAKLLRDHYRNQQGGYLSFALGTQAWAGHTSATDLVPAGARWVYADQPEETHKRGGYVDVTVQLVSVI